MVNQELTRESECILIAVDEALQRILGSLKPMGAEPVTFEDAFGRTLAEEIIAERATPPADTSAMDGYAVRFDDLSSLPFKLKILGEAPAGSPYPGVITPSTCVRIFTGGLVPSGADTVIIQENTERDDDTVTILKRPDRGANIRRAGMDFNAGDTLFSPGNPLNERDLALIASANKGTVMVMSRPRVALFSTGDELVQPGSALKDGSVINSNIPALEALIRTVGAKPVSLGIIPDELSAIETALVEAQKTDLIVTLGGASVGDYDFVQEAFKNTGGKLDFWKIAMKPGKPLIFGDLNGVPVLGLPGNPVSAYVTAFLFLLPALRKMQRQTDVSPAQFPALAGADIPQTGDRETYYLGTMTPDKNGRFLAFPFARQDSAKISALQAANCLIRCKAGASAVTKGDPLIVLPLS